jgi:hypothetical protein
MWHLDKVSRSVPGRLASLSLGCVWLGRNAVSLSRGSPAVPLPRPGNSNGQLLPINLVQGTVNQQFIKSVGLGRSHHDVHSAAGTILTGRGRLRLQSVQKQAVA